MSRRTWIPAGDTGDDSGYTVMACMQIDHSLYTFVAMPAEHDRISNRRIETSLPSGEVLPWRVYSGTGAEAGEIAYTRGTPPPDDTTELKVQVFEGDRLVCSARMLRALPSTE